MTNVAFLLEDWLVEPAQHRISRAGAELHLTPRVMAVLLCLVEHAGEVVSRDTFGAVVWAPAVVSDDALTGCIAELRRVLGEAKSGPRFIETVPKRGYRLVATVSRQSTAPAKPFPESDAPMSLPAQRSGFIGRVELIRDVKALLKVNRLVTLTGPGGTGKTRLGIKVAEQIAAQFHDGVFFVDLAAISDGGLLPRTVAIAMDLPLQGEERQDGISGVVQFLKSRVVLLLLDNCEHVLAAAADFADEVLEHSPEVVMLATSRESLSVPGEQIIRVSPLQLTAKEGDSPEAVQLFIARARETADPGFDPQGDNAAAVVDICERLDGLPLAIELAAARVAHLAPADIANKLDQRLQLLTGGSRQKPKRQQTLQATIEWSYGLLSDFEQKLFARLSVFAGGFSLAAVEGICVDDLGGADAALDLIAALVAKSLIVAEQGAGVTRYRLLETLKFFAAERLYQSGSIEDYRRRHRDWFLAWVQTYPLDEAIYRFDIIDTLAREIENFRAALDWSVEQMEIDVAVRMAVALAGVWAFGNHHEEGKHRLYELYRRPDIKGSLKDLCYGAAVLVGGVNVFAIVEVDDQLIRNPPLNSELASLVLSMHSGRSAERSGGDLTETRKMLNRALSLARENGQLHQEQWVLGLSAQFDILDGKFDAVISTRDQIRQDGPGLTLGDLYLRQNVGWAYCMKGELAEACEVGLAMVALVPQPSMSSRHYPLLGHMIAGYALAEMGRLDEAREHLRAVTLLTLSRPHPLHDVDCLIGYVIIHAADGDFERACVLLNSIPGTYRHLATHFRRSSARAIYDRYLNLVREKLEPDEFNRLAAVGYELKTFDLLREEVAG